MKKPYEEARKLVEGTLAEIPGLRRGSSTLTLLSWFAAGAAVGSAVMYLLDPEQGRARRTKIQERGAAWKNEATRAASEKSRTWKEGAQSLWSKASGALPGEHEALADNRDTKAESYLH